MIVLTEHLNTYDVIVIVRYEKFGKPIIKFGSKYDYWDSFSHLLELLHVNGEN